MDLNLIRIAVTLLSLTAFLGIVWWAYKPANRQRFESDAQIPLTEE